MNFFYLTDLGSYLVTALPNLDVHNLTHLGPVFRFFLRSREFKIFPYSSLITRFSDQPRLRNRRTIELLNFLRMSLTKTVECHFFFMTIDNLPLDLRN